MSAEARLVTALSTTGLPVYNGVAFGEEDTYITFDVTRIPDGYADDGAEFDRLLPDVHLYAPLAMNVTALRKTITAALTGAGFTRPVVTDASDKDGRHLVFECEDAEGADDGDDDD